MDNFHTITASSRFIGKLVIIIIYEITTKVNKKTIYHFPEILKREVFHCFLCENYALDSTARCLTYAVSETYKDLA